MQCKSLCIQCYPVQEPISHILDFATGRLVPDYAPLNDFGSRTADRERAQRSPPSLVTSSPSPIEMSSSGPKGTAPGLKGWQLIVEEGAPNRVPCVSWKDIGFSNSFYHAERNAALISQSKLDFSDSAKPDLKAV